MALVAPRRANGNAGAEQNFEGGSAWVMECPISARAANLPQAAVHATHDVGHGLEAKTSLSFRNCDTTKHSCLSHGDQHAEPEDKLGSGAVRKFYDRICSRRQPAE